MSTTANTTGSAWPPFDLEKMTETLRLLQPVKPFTGQIVMVEDGKFITDPKSGIMYCTKAGFEQIKSQIGTKEPRP